MTYRSVLVTGGAGFIGSEVVRQFIGCTDIEVVSLDKLTYAGNLDSLATVLAHPRHHFEQADITDRVAVDRIFREYRPQAVMHLAAESHVDRSIDGPQAFVRTNILGTATLLEAARSYWNGLEGPLRGRFRFHHISTDEVYGSLADGRQCSEGAPYEPSSPYSASKASSDHLVRAWHQTYGLPVLVTHSSNNYGPCQFPEKLIPLMILAAMEGAQLPLYGAGHHVRDWLYVGDHARALRLVLERGRAGQTYHIGGHNERTNLEVVCRLCTILDELLPTSPHRPHAELIGFVADRPGHDLRYAIDASRIQRELGWAPQESFESGLRRTVQWYLDNLDWCARVQDGHGRGERLGLRAVR